MIAQVGRTVSLSRRRLVSLAALVAGAYRGARPASAQSPDIERTLVAMVTRDDGLQAPLTLGMARVVLRPDASTPAATPGGARVFRVESGYVAVAPRAQAALPITAADLALTGPTAHPDYEILLPAGAALAFVGSGISNVRNPGKRPAVVLDVAVYHAESRPLPHAFTTDDGVSFQLLASASADAVPPGAVVVALERLRLGPRARLPADLSRGLTLLYVDAGSLALRPSGGEVFAAHAAASAPYSMPGSLQPVPADQRREVTAGGVIFLPDRAEAVIANATGRIAALFAVQIREAP